jgi:hypothetical protein
LAEAFDRLDEAMLVLRGRERVRLSAELHFDLHRRDAGVELFDDPTESLDRLR